MFPEITLLEEEKTRIPAAVPPVTTLPETTQLLEFEVLIPRDMPFEIVFPATVE